MQTSILVKVGGFLIAALLLAGLWVTRETWTGWLVPKKDDDEPKKADASDGPERVKLSPQARRNLRLAVEEMKPKSYWKSVVLPGTVIDRPGHSDRGVPTPFAGVVTWVNAVPGKTVRIGDELFRIRLSSETFQASQMELYKSAQELKLVEAKRKRLESIGMGAVPETTLLELDYQQQRLIVAIKAHRQDMQTRQLTDKQVADIEEGKLVTEVVIRMQELHAHRHGPDAPPAHGSEKPVEFEVQELKVNRGDFVQAGQILAYVADHSRLYLEGRALKQEAKLLHEAAQKGWQVEAEFTAGDDDTPADRLTGLKVEFLGAVMDPSGLTLPVYIPFDNPPREYVIKDKTYRVGHYRPGQKVLLRIDVAEMSDVFVLPLAGVVREGPEAYVFRQNGDTFDRRPVHVMYEDAQVAVIKNDGSILPGDSIVQNAAAALQRVLKASQAEGGGGHEHHHH
jgi:multidrug efflux pump subunit AcrA (membrane-fusion protein)